MRAVAMQGRRIRPVTRTVFASVGRVFQSACQPSPYHGLSRPTPFMLLTDKKILVTGGSRGIGRALCHVLAREGADIAFCYATSHGAAEETAALVRAHGRDALAVQADVGDRAAAAAFVEQAHDHFGRVDAVVLNAGINRTTLFLRMPDDDWDDIIRTNVDGLYNVGKPAFRIMARQKGGSFLAISSISGIRTAPAGVPYAVSKAASIGFTKGIAREGGRFGIRANAIAVGIVDTDLAGTIPDRFVRTYEKHAALGRTGHPDEVAELASFLLSDRNSYMSGEVIVQDGGTVV